MKPWLELYRQHTSVRDQPPTWTSEVRKRLIALADAGHCDGSIRSRFTKKRVRGLDEWRIQPAQSDDPSDHEPLRAIDGMRAASLGVFALVRKGDAIRQFDVRATGERENGTPWVVAVHLSNDGAQKGQHGFGACGHAVLHCHVGPDMDAVPKVRVPLPALGPAEALDWVLSQLIPTPRFEPAPWAEIETMLKKATP